MPDSKTSGELLERTVGSVLGAMDLFALYLGNRLGYYEILATHGPMTTHQLADLAGTDERYTREWIEQQVVSGLLTVDDHLSTNRRFSIPEGYVAALTDARNLDYVQGLVSQILVSGFRLNEIAVAHRTGGGVSWAEFGDEMRDAQGAINRPVLEGVFAQEWLASIPRIDAKLLAGAHVADIGCGYGWSAIGIAEAYPDVVVDGFDVDAPSIERARLNAQESGVADRVRFHPIDAGDTEVEGIYDIVLTVEVIHDLPDPVSTLETMRRISAEDAIVIVVDMNAAETFDPGAGDIERLLYGFSNFICLPEGKSHGHTVATGTLMRPDTLRSYAKEAGFEEVLDLPIEPDIWRFYELR